MAQWFWRRRFFKFVKVFSHCRNYLPLENLWPFIWKNSRIPLTQGWFVPRRTGPFIWTKLNPLHPRMHFAKFGWNWPSDFGEEDGNVESLRQWQQRRRITITTTDKGKFWSEKLTWDFGSGKLKTPLLCPKWSGRGRQEFTKKVCEENADRNYAEIVLICMMQTTFIPGIVRQKPDNCTYNNRIIDKTFEEIDSFSKLIITFKIEKKKKKNRASHAKFYIPNFFIVR